MPAIALRPEHGPRRGRYLVVVGCVMAAAGVVVGLDSVTGIPLWSDLVGVPLLAAVCLAVGWHARHSVDAVRAAELRADESRSMLERQERFILDASHELRTPVTIARGHLELLRRQAGAGPELDVALDELARMDAILERLFVLAKADQPDFVLTSEVDLEPLLEDVFMRWTEVARRAWRLGPLAPGRLRVDADRLRAALDALLENAVKYSEPGTAIELRAVDDGHGHVSIEVQDEGCGVPDGALERIFDRFARADPARTRAAGGVGLGLAIADTIAKAHGGGCRVSRTPNGSIFALSLPGFAPRAPGSPAPARDLAATEEAGQPTAASVASGRP